MNRRLPTNKSAAIGTWILLARAFEAILDLLKKDVWGSGRLIVVKSKKRVEVTMVIGRAARKNVPIL
jgi:hypothetical protein